MVTVWKHLGVPITAHKTDGPMTSLVFLEIEIDTVRLPESKLTKVVDQEVERETVVFQEGATVAHWTAPECLLCREAGTILLEADDRLG